MRVKSDDFGKRPDKVKQERAKYFLIYEGEITEPMYFEGIIANREKLALKESISLVSVLRSIEDINKSHPKYALEMAKDIKLQSKEGVISKENLGKYIEDFCEKENLNNKEDMLKLLKNIYLNMRMILYI